MKVTELLARPEAWTKGECARDAAGEPVNSSDADAVCFCLLGAVVRCYPEKSERMAAFEALTAAVNARPGDFHEIAIFNDEHDHAAVLAAAEKANV